MVIRAETLGRGDAAEWAARRARETGKSVGKRWTIVRQHVVETLAAADGHLSTAQIHQLGCVGQEVFGGARQSRCGPPQASQRSGRTS